MEGWKEAAKEGSQALAREVQPWVVWLGWESCCPCICPVGEEGLGLEERGRGWAGSSCSPLGPASAWWLGHCTACQGLGLFLLLSPFLFFFPFNLFFFLGPFSPPLFSSVPSLSFAVPDPPRYPTIQLRVGQTWQTHLASLLFTLYVLSQDCHASGWGRTSRDCWNIHSGLQHQKPPGTPQYSWTRSQGQPLWGSPWQQRETLSSAMKCYYYLVNPFFGSLSSALQGAL